MNISPILTTALVSSLTVRSGNAFTLHPITNTFSLNCSPHSFRSPTSSHRLSSMQLNGINHDGDPLSENQEPIQPRLMKPVHRLSVKCDHPCYLSTDNNQSELMDNEQQKQNKPRNLFITGFNLFKTHVSEAPNIGNLISTAKERAKLKAGDNTDKPLTMPFTSTLKSDDQVADTTKLATHFRWPNEAKEVSEHIFNQERQLVIGDGFLLPVKCNGGLFRYDIDTGKTTRLLAPKPGWFYHKAEFIKVHGQTVMITARANKPGIFGGKPKGELVWATPPKNHDAPGPVRRGIQEGPYWDEHVIGKGADFLFEVEDINGNGFMDVIATEFEGRQLSLFRFVSISEEGIPKWEKQTLASGVGKLFSLQVVDLNSNGVNDILFTNHANDETAGVFALENKGDQWQLHVLAKGIETRRKAKGEASPGNAEAFMPDKKYPDQKPHIVLSGDGSGCAYLMKPKSQDKDDWRYTFDTLLDAGDAMIGQVIAEDLDGDGYIEIGVPVYSWDSIEFFSYEPGDASEPVN